MTALLDRVDAQDLSQDDDDTIHLICCCTPNVSMCGEDVTSYSMVELSYGDEFSECETCMSLFPRPCILCGYSPYNGKECFCGEC